MDERYMWIGFVIVFAILLQIVTTTGATLSSYIGLICSLLGFFISFKKES